MWYRDYLFAVNGCHIVSFKCVDAATATVGGYMIVCLIVSQLNNLRS